MKSLYIKHSKVSIYCMWLPIWRIKLYIYNVRTSVTLGVVQLSSEWRHTENDVIMRTGAASAVGARRTNDVIMKMMSQ